MVHRPGAGQRDGIDPVDPTAAEDDVTLGGHVEPGNDPQHGRLAGTVGAEHCQHAAGRHRQVDAVQHLDGAVARTDVSQLDHGLGDGDGQVAWPFLG